MRYSLFVRPTYYQDSIQHTTASRLGYTPCTSWEHRIVEQTLPKYYTQSSLSQRARNHTSPNLCQEQEPCRYVIPRRLLLGGGFTNKRTQTINDAFRHYYDDVNLWSFYEAYPTTSGLLSRVIVEKDSAQLGNRTARIYFPSSFIDPVY